ncbi:MULTISPECIES: hypothetical protein [unclassified Microcoleus]|jgi:hypothetical protein|uniref:hypothetical protein n=1 Tax=unclassified Microcoleus TaxID=2642155 RepID=UPI001DC1171F|nr:MULTISPECIES: hypothetical protein [unclassified Microcoleus]MCC3600083.1 hypothetical protein [Microcoleus sp. PH2017_26_ELK_O_A]MCC3625061.1 hypothetical protein [Microcoleus sp. PH2017_36_ELK_O_B]
MEYGKYDGITQVVQQPQPSITFPATINLESHVGSSCIALATVAGLTLFVREIRLLVKACKDS